MDELMSRFRPIVEQMSYIAKFGYGSEDARQPHSEDVNTTKEGKKRIPGMALTSYENFAKLFSDKGTDLTDWKEVESLEEAVRYLHAAIIRTTQVFSYYVGNYTNNKFSRDADKDSGLEVLDVTSKGKESSPIYNVFENGTVRKLGGQAKNYFTVENRTPVAIIGDDYGEFTFPGGKHYVELNTNIHANPPDFAIALRYVESGYGGAIQRQDFAANVFESLGFKVERVRTENGTLKAFFHSSSKEDWQKNFSDAIRLVASLKDLDLKDISPNAVEYFLEGGVEHFQFYDELVMGLAKDKIDKNIVSRLNYLIKDKNEFEINFLAKMMVENTKDFSKLLPYLAALGMDELDRIITAFYELADDMKKDGQTKFINKVNQYADKAVELMDQKFHS